MTAKPTLLATSLRSLLAEGPADLAERGVPRGEVRSARELQSLSSVHNSRGSVTLASCGNTGPMLPNLDNFSRESTKLDFYLQPLIYKGWQPIQTEYTMGARRNLSGGVLGPWPDSLQQRMCWESELEGTLMSPLLGHGDPQQRACRRGLWLDNSPPWHVVSQGSDCP